MHYFLSVEQEYSSEYFNYLYINIDEVGISREDLFKLTGGYTVPQIVMSETPIGGFDQLLILNQKGKLNDLSDKN